MTVIKIGDTPAEFTSKAEMQVRRARHRVLSGPRPVTDWGKYWHTHVIPSVADLPDLIAKEFLYRRRKKWIVQNYRSEKNGMSIHSWICPEDFKPFIVLTKHREPFLLG